MAKTKIIEWLKKNKDQILVGILVGIILLIIPVFFSFFSKPSEDKSRQLLSSTKIEQVEKSISQKNPEFSLKSYPLADLSATSTQTLLNKVRKEHNVRALLALESGKRLADSPNQTYSFVAPFYLNVSAYEDYSEILSGMADRFDVFYGGYFEVHKINNDEIYLLGYISDETFANINNGNIKTLTLFPFPDPQRQLLLVLPTKYIKEAGDREITFDDGSYVRILDLRLSNQ